MTYLITASAARFQQFRIVTFAVDFIVVHAIRQIDQQFVASVAGKATRMPHNAFHEFRSGHHHVAHIDFTFAMGAVFVMRCILNVTCGGQKKSNKFHDDVVPQLSSN